MKNLVIPLCPSWAMNHASVHYIHIVCPPNPNLNMPKRSHKRHACVVPHSTPFAQESFQEPQYMLKTKKTIEPYIYIYTIIFLYIHISDTM